MAKLPLFLFLFLVLTKFSLAQQQPQYSQYMLNNFLLNPAVAGIENYTDLKCGYRNQWTGLNGAPVTSYLTINAPIGHMFTQGDATALPPSGSEDPAGRSLLTTYQAAEPHHGIGFSVVNDKTGPVTATSLDLSYAYHIGLAKELNLAMGFSAGLSTIALDRSAIRLAKENDPILREGIANQWKPDLDAGLWLYSAVFYAGISARQLIARSLYFTGSSASDQRKSLPSYFLTAGLKLFLSEDLSVLPSFLVEETRSVPLSYDLNIKFSYLDRLWVGVSYRRKDSFAALLGININSLINIGYSYDLTLSTLNKVSSGSHEIVLGFLLNNRYRVRCPQRSF